MITPDWERVAPMLREIAGDLSEATPEQTAAIDQSNAAARDYYDEVGVPLADPDNIYCGLVFISDFIGRLNHCMRLDLMPAEDAETVVACLRGLVAMVLPFVPDGVVR